MDVGLYLILVTPGAASLKRYLNINDVTDICKQRGWGYNDHGDAQPFSDEQFKKVAELMGNFAGNPAYRGLFENLASWIVKRLRPRKTFEFGCGPGYLIECLTRMGVDACGLDGNRHFWNDFQVRHYSNRHRYIIDPLFEKPVQKADALISIEVFEHIPDEALHRIMTRVRDEVSPDFIVFSSTPFASEVPCWDVRWGHINLKQPEAWVELFLRYGFRLHDVKPPVTEWAQLYVSAR
jgi:2-polyprenyl-3-methyl-5-hydroxy-6-metoxy-1,4-benzoquinol methylase